MGQNENLTGSSEADHASVRVDERGNVVGFTPQGFTAEELQDRLQGVASPEEAMQRLGIDVPDADMDHGDEARVASTQQMAEIVAEARAMNLNRRLDIIWVGPSESVDESNDLMPDRNHVLSPIMVHRYAQEQPVEPHMRVQAHLFYRDGVISRPTTRILDIPMGLWKRLPTYETLRDANPEIRRLAEQREQWSRDTAMARRRIGRRGPQ